MSMNYFKNIKIVETKIKIVKKYGFDKDEMIDISDFSIDEIKSMLIQGELESLEEIYNLAI